MFALAVVLLATDWTWLAAPITAVVTLLVSWWLNRRQRSTDSAQQMVDMAETVATMSHSELDRAYRRIAELEAQLRDAGEEPAPEQDSDWGDPAP